MKTFSNFLLFFLLLVANFLVAQDHSNGLCGTYTIGGDTPDFETFNAAVDELEAYGVCGTVVFDVRDGVYEEQVVIPEIVGTGEDSQIIFQSESGDSTGVELSYTSTSSSDNYVLLLDGADWVSLQKITIYAKATAYGRGRAVVLQNNINTLRIERCVIKGEETLSNDTKELIKSDGVELQGHVLIKNNLFIGGSSAIDLNHRFDVEDNTVEVKIVQNKCINQEAYGINLLNFMSPFISENDIQTEHQDRGYIAIHLRSCKKNISITKNKLVQKAGAGIIVYSVNSLEDKVLILNNFVQTSGPSHAYRNTATPGSITLWFCSNTKIYNNSLISSESDEPSVYIHGSEIVDIKNNILAHFGSGPIYRIRDTPLENLSIDYNNYYQNKTFETNTISFPSNQYFSLIRESASSTNFTYWTYDNWLTNTGQDEHSLTEHPYFYKNECSYRSQQEALICAGTPLPEVTEDIEGDLRDEIPEIGADEWVQQNYDARIARIYAPNGPITPGSYPITVTLKNEGVENITAAKIDLRVNDNLIYTTDWTGDLAQKDTVLIALGMVDFETILQSYQLTATVELLNPSIDLEPLNDTLSTDTLYTAMGGIYTIGGENPDFNSFNEAIFYLNKTGVYDHCIFKVRDGIYHEKVGIGTISGASENSQIIFQSESEDSTAVRLINDEPTSSGSVIDLFYAKWITFKQMTINSNYEFGTIRIKGASSHNTFEGNIIGNYNDQSFGGVQIRSNDGFPGDRIDNTFKSNIFQGIGGGLYYSGGTNEKDQINLIGNTFIGQLGWGIFTVYVENINVVNNKIYFTFDENTMSSSIFTGMEISFLNEYANVVNNEIYIKSDYFYNPQSSPQYGINLTHVKPVENGTIANNFINIYAPAQYSTGILGNNSQVNLFYNTVRMNAREDSYGLRLLESEASIFNNIYSHLGQDMAFNITTSVLQNLDYNNYHVSGEIFGLLDGQSVGNLEDWQNLSTYDNHSLSENPYFEDTLGYKIQNLSLNRFATPLPEISTDITGKSRDETAPDMGVYEFSPLALDVGVLDILSPTEIVDNVSTPLYVNLYNYGLDPLISTQIYWAINGALQGDFLWEGQLASGEISDSILIGHHLFGDADKYEISAWTKLPNQMEDEKILNDTAKIEGVTLGLKGIYTIGGNRPDFLDFNEAVAALIKQGIVGSVFFQVRDGLYNEQIEIPEIKGTSEEQTITFQSESGDNTKVYLYHGDGQNGNRHVIWLNGADWVTFKDMTIECTSSSNQTAFLLTNEATHNHIDNNIIRGFDYIYDREERGGIHSRDGVNTHNTVSYNKIILGGYGILWEGDSNSHLDIIGNEFYEQSYTGLGLDRVKKATITKNKFEKQLTGIRVRYCSDTIIINQNDIEVKNSAIHILQSNVEIFNNFIKSTHTNGVYAWDVSSLKCFNNNFYIEGNGDGYGLSFSSSHHLWFVNNNVFTMNRPAVRIFDYNETNYLDYNNYYVKGDSDLFYIVQNSPQTYYADLEAWQTETRDVHSISLPSLYVSEKDLHVRQAGLDGAGIFLTQAATDIDDETRAMDIPDIGADEFSPSPNDVGVAGIITPEQPFTEGEHPIQILLLNQGTTLLESATLDWSINGVAQPPLLWTGALEPDDSLIVNLANVNFNLVNQPYSFTVQSSLPNDGVDAYAPNNDAETVPIYLGLAGIYTIGGDEPDFKDMNEAVNTLNKIGILDAVTFNIRKGLYNEQFIIQNIQGANENKKVTFQSEDQDSTSVILSYNNSQEDDFLIKMENVAWTNWKHLTLSSRNRPNGKIFQLNNTYGTHVFESNRIIGAGNQSDLITISSPIDDLSSQYMFKNNHFINGSKGLVYEGVDNDKTKMLFINNYFDNQHLYGLYLTDIETIEFFENKITAFDNYATGLYIEKVKTKLDISKNYIHIIDGFGGISLKSIYITQERHQLTNNFIQIGRATNFGIKVDNCWNLNIYANTVRAHFMSVPSYYESACFYFNNGNNHYLFNNNFSCTGEGHAIRLQTDPSLFFSDYNNFYSKDFSFARRGNDLYENLEDWQQVGYGDTHSFSTDPLFLNETGQHISSPFLNGTGIPLEIEDDLEGDIRNNFPDIGADEFTLYDLAALQITEIQNSCDLSEAEIIRFQLKNNSLNTINDFSLAYQINNQNPVTENFTGQALEPNDERTYIFQTPADFSTTQTYILKVFTQLENDENIFNNTLSSTIVHYPTDTTELIHITCDPNEVSSTETLLTNQFGCDSLLIQNTILDNIPPIANCQNITLNLSGHSVEINALDINNNSSDNCMIDFMGLDVATFDCDQLGEHLVQLTVADQAGNQASCEAIVTVEDSAAPNANCIESLDITLVADEPYVLDVQTLNAQSSDNCSLAENLGLSFLAFSTTKNIALDCDDIALESLELWVTDEAGHQDFCEVTINVERGNRDCNCEKTNLDFGTAWIAPTIYKVSNQITAAGQVNSPNQAVIFRAGESIELLGGFEVVLGSSFSAEIEGCLISGGSLSDQDMAQQYSRENALNSSSLAEMDLKIIPNPFSNKAVIKYDLLTAQKIEISLLHLSGKLIKTLQEPQWQTTGQHQIELDGTALEAGIYLIRWRGEESQGTEKVVLYR